MPQWFIDFVIPIAGFLFATLVTIVINSIRGQITELWTKHNEDADRLQELEIHVAREHYVKSELDSKFDRLEKTISDGLDKLGNKFDILSARLLEK